MTDTTDTQMRRFFERDPRRYAAHLKYLRLYDNILLNVYHEQDSHTGAVISYPAGAVHWDRTIYPRAYKVVMPVITSHKLAPWLADLFTQSISPETQIVFKFCDTITTVAVGHLYDLHYARSFISYTTGNDWPRMEPSGVIRVTLQAVAPVKLFYAQGYSSGELAHLFERGAVAFVREVGNEVVAACLAYPNTDDLWEVGALYTVEGARRRGHGQAVVTAALNWVLEQDYTPRYQTDDDNGASLGLAASIGLVETLRLSHYVKEATY